MRALPLLLPLLLGACAGSTAHPGSGIRNVRYSAIGHDPLWMLVIGDHSIAFRKEGQAWQLRPRTLPRTVDGVRIWRSREDPDDFVVEAYRGRCTDARGQTYEDHVVVRLTHDIIDLRDGSLDLRSHEELRGCGGRQLRAEDR